MLQLDYENVIKRFPFAFCGELSMFGALQQDTVEFLMHEGKLLQFEPGEHLFRTGEESDHFYIILSGNVGYYHNNGEQLVHIRSYRAGEQIGFVGMIGLHPRRGDCIAEQPSCLLEVSAELFQRVCAERAEQFAIFLINMTREMSREISDLDNICSRLKQNNENQPQTS